MVKLIAGTNYVGSRLIKPTRQLTSYTLVSALAEKSPVARLKLSVNADNLFDRAAQSNREGALSLPTARCSSRPNRLKPLGSEICLVV